MFNSQNVESTREKTNGFVTKCMLQSVYGPVLEFTKIKVKAHAEMVENATGLQAQHLARLEVVKSHRDLEHGAGNQEFVLFAFWRSLDQLSGDI